MTHLYKHPRHGRVPGIPEVFGTALMVLTLFLSALAPAATAATTPPGTTCNHRA